MRAADPRRDAPAGDDRHRAPASTLARLAGKLAKPGGVAEILPGARGGLPRAPAGRARCPASATRTGALLERFAIRTVGDLRARLARGALRHLRAARAWCSTSARAGSTTSRSSRPTPRPPTARCGRARAALDPPRQHLRARGGPARDRRGDARLPRRPRRRSACAPTPARRDARGARAPTSTRARARAPARPQPRRAARGRRARRHGRAAPRPREPSDSTDELWRAARELFALAPPPPRAGQAGRAHARSTSLRAPGWQRRLFGDPHARTGDGAPTAPAATTATAGPRPRARPAARAPRLRAHPARARACRWSRPTSWARTASACAPRP